MIKNVVAHTHTHTHTQRDRQTDTHRRTHAHKVSPQGRAWGGSGRQSKPCRCHPMASALLSARSCMPAAIYAYIHTHVMLINQKRVGIIRRQQLFYHYSLAVYSSLPLLFHSSSCGGIGINMCGNMCGNICSVIRVLRCEAMPVLILY